MRFDANWSPADSAIGVNWTWRGQCGLRACPSQGYRSRAQEPRFDSPVQTGWPVLVTRLMWTFLLPFRLVGIAVEGALKLVWAVVTLPARLLAAPFRV
jgi:hypothetical protein